ncbi:hypothetical protein [Clostridium sp. DL1XJH146]
MVCVKIDKRVISNMDNNGLQKMKCNCKNGNTLEGHEQFVNDSQI